ncbi:hypothetical protein T484DRAFT_1808120 [Baffinella frigidus]|nr:hypothetical protein T484DRAFT_1808120 [Cryptophyta sp. CCMP2293]
MSRMTNHSIFGISFFGGDTEKDRSAKELEKLHVEVLNGLLEIKALYKRLESPVPEEIEQKIAKALEALRYVLTLSFSLIITSDMSRMTNHSIFGISFFGGDTEKDRSAKELEKLHLDVLKGLLEIKARYKRLESPTPEEIEQKIAKALEALRRIVMAVTVLHMALAELGLDAA